MRTATNNSLRTRLKLQYGLSLVEMMVSITIGLLILVSMSSMFINQSRARAELDKTNRMIDNGRYATELLSENMRLAGFYGSFIPQGAPTVLYDPCDIPTLLNPTLNLDLLRMHVQGYDAATTNSQIANPPCALTNAAGSTESLKPGSDVIAIRRTSTFELPQAATALQPAAPNDGTVYLQASTCQHEIASNQYRISNDTTTLKLGQRNISAATPAYPAAPYNNCVTLPGGVISIVAPFASLRAVKVEVYFVSPDNKLGDGIPTLKRRELSVNGGIPAIVTTPLVEGVEFMQVEYGLDTDNNGSPDNYDSCAACTLDQWASVVSINLILLTRNVDETRNYSDKKTYTMGLAGNIGPLNDSYKRHVFTQLVRLTNPSSRREAP